MAFIYESVRGLLSDKIFMRQLQGSDSSSDNKYGKILGLCVLLGELPYKEEKDLSADVMHGIRSFTYEGFVTHLLEEALQHELDKKLGPPTVGLLFDLEEDLNELEENPTSIKAIDRVKSGLQTLESLLEDSALLDGDKPVVDAFALHLFKSIADKEALFPYKGVLPHYSNIVNFCVSRDILLQGGFDESA